MAEERTAAERVGGARRQSAATSKSNSEILPRASGWCKRWLGCALVAVGWVLAVVAVLIPYGAEWIALQFDTAVAAAMALGFGAGWESMKRWK